MSQKIENYVQYQLVAFSDALPLKYNTRRCD